MSTNRKYARDPKIMRGEFIGRDRELAEMAAGLEDAFAGRGGVYLVSGEPGIGKTTLAERLASHAAARGARVVWSRSWDGGGAAPYWTWAQVVRSLGEGLDAEALDGFASAEIAHVALLAPELADRFGNGSARIREPESDAGRFYLFDATSRFLRHLASKDPLVLILDDVLAGDGPSLLLLRFLARDVRDSRVLVVATYRGTEAARSPETLAVLADVVREGHVVDLQPLGREEVGRLVAGVAGVTPTPDRIPAIHEATGGNPLFVREVTRLLASEGLLERRGPLTVPVPESVRAVIRRRMAPLSADAVRVLSAAAVVGRCFDLTLVGAACDLPPDAVLEALADPVALGFVREPADPVGPYEFSHPLMREAIYLGLPVAARTQMHRAVGVAIERVHAADPLCRVNELAHHFSRAAAIGESERAGRYARQAGDRAMASFAYEDAVLQYRRALDALALHGEPDPALRSELLVLFGRALARAGNYPESRKASLLAADLAREIGDPERLAQAALVAGEPQVEGGLVDRDLVGLLEEANEALGPGDSPLRSRVAARLSLEFTFAEDEALRENRRESLSLEAIRMARRLGDVVALCSALRARWLARWGPDGLEERTALAEEHLSLAHETGDREIELLARARRITCALEAGRGTAAASDIAAHGRLADELGMPYHEWAAATMRAGQALAAGAFDRVEDLAQKALDRLPGRPNAFHAHLIHLTMLRWEQGRLDEMRGAWRGVIERFPQLAFAHAWLGLAEAASGNREAARGALTALVAEVPGLPRNGLWLPALALSSRLAVELDDADAAAALYGQLLPYSDRTVLIPMPHPAISLGSAAFYVAALATRTVDWDAAERHFEAAKALHSRLGARPFQARTFAEHARMLLRRGRPEDRARAATLLDRAGSLAATIGMHELTAKLDALGERAAAHADSGIAGPRERASSETAAVPRERTPSERTAPNVFRREGEYWTVAYDGAVIRLRDTKGLRCLSRLLARPGTEVPAVELEAWDAEGAPSLAVAGASRSNGLDPRPDLGDAGAMLDEQAKAEYRERIEDLRAEGDEARRFNDPERAARADEELAFLTSEISRAVGLGGRDRRAGSHSERARLNVTRAIRAAMEAIAREHPSLGEHLSHAVRTGRACSYAPDPRVPITWEV